jgi:hypothetical protein
VVLAHGVLDPDVAAEIQALGGEVIITSSVCETSLRDAVVEQAKAAVILGDNDVLAIRIALMIAEIAPGLRQVIEMTNPNLGSTVTELIGDCTMLSSAELAAPAFVAAALATAETHAFEIGGRMVAAGPGIGSAGRCSPWSVTSGSQWSRPAPDWLACSAPPRRRIRRPTRSEDRWPCEGRMRAQRTRKPRFGRFPGCLRAQRTKRPSDLSQLGRASLASNQVR